MAFRSKDMCDGALVGKPSCWWESEALPEILLKGRLRGAIRFREWCLEQGLTTEDGQWLFDLPQDWTWNGETWLLEKVVNFAQHKRLKLAELKGAKE
jgi:hypothetical protein